MTQLLAMSSLVLSPPVSPCWQEGPVGMSSGLFYLLLGAGTVLFLLAFIYSRRHRS